VAIYLYNELFLGNMLKDPFQLNGKAVVVEPTRTGIKFTQQLLVQATSSKSIE
jgi:hypothetical protein